MCSHEASALIQLHVTALKKNTPHSSFVKGNRILARPRHPNLLGHHSDPRPLPHPSTSLRGGSGCTLFACVVTSKLDLQKHLARAAEEVRPADAIGPSGPSL